MDRLETVVIVGLGLIGGSIGLAIRRRGAADRIVGVDLDPARLAEARRRRAIDEAAPTLDSALAEADLAVICTPVTATVPLIHQAAHLGRARLLITDVGSTKGRIVAEAEADPLTRQRFVGSHPIAGSERQGVEHAQADLFEGRVVALTPTAQTPLDLVRRCRAFWTDLGAATLELDPATHDERLARTSHLPHAVASALAGLVPTDLLPLAAGAHRDGTRVAGAEGHLWAGIFLDNRRPLLEALAAFRGQLAAFEAALIAGDAASLVAWWDQNRPRRPPSDLGGTSPPSPPASSDPAPMKG